VNTWNSTTDPKGAIEYPSPAAGFIQWLGAWIAGIITSTKFFNALPGYWQAQFIATTTMLLLPPLSFGNPDPTIKSYKPDALHFTRGVSVSIIQIDISKP
jgi:hypothetical protein